MKTKFTVRRLMRTLSILCFIFCFCPSFLVSCGGESTGINVMTAVKGITAQGHRFAEPQPAMVLCYIIPLLIIIVLSLRNWPEYKAAILVLFSADVDTVYWIIFWASTRRSVEEAGYAFEVTRWFVCNMISLAAIIVLSVLVLKRKVRLDPWPATVRHRLPYDSGGR